MKAYNVCFWSLYLDGLIHTWTASRSTPGWFQKTKYCFKYQSLTLLQNKSNKLKYIKAIFSGLPPDLELDLLEQDPTVQPNFWHEIWNPNPKKPIFRHTWRHIMFVIGVYTWKAWSIPGQPPDQPQEDSKRLNMFFNI